MKVLYFGVLSEITGIRSEELSFEGTADQFRRFIAEKYPALETKSFQVAVDQKIVSLEALLREESEVALLPPFTGG
jgi:molybdopterin synthase sulfur carrier subunit